MARKDKSDQTKTGQDKQVWITPKIFDSPVIEVTGGDLDESAFDGQGYS
ncbi:MAG: hypothetical protein ACE5DO_13575 [Desulfobacterales bacterium]